ncbi:MAG TPA: hypothetical protein VD866_10760 [Urbifossiella sp.]|nr:hypothetical protein [Urbifossiella sp.]
MRCLAALLVVPILAPWAAGDERPRPIPDQVVRAWEADAGARHGRSAALRLFGPPANDPFEVKAAKAGELPTFVVTYKDLPGPGRKRVLADLRTVPAPDVPFALYVYEWAAGGRLQQVNRFPTVESLNCSCAHVSEVDVAALTELRNLRSLDLSLTQITWGAPSALTGFPKLIDLNLCGTLLHDRTTDLIVEKLPRLQALNINDTPVTDVGLRTLAGHKDLRHLHLRGTKVTDVGLTALSPMGLRTLDLGSTRVTDAGLKHLGGLTSLEALMLYRTGVTDRGVAELAGLTRLQHLNLNVTGGIGDAGLKVIGRLPELESMILKLDAGVTEDALTGLSALPKLRQCHLTCATLDAAKVARLQAALPGCKLTWTRRD